jgi:hypothetical protein
MLSAFARRDKGQMHGSYPLWTGKPEEALSFIVDTPRGNLLIRSYTPRTVIPRSKVSRSKEYMVTRPGHNCLVVAMSRRPADTRLISYDLFLLPSSTTSIIVFVSQIASSLGGLVGRSALSTRPERMVSRQAQGVYSQ